LVLKQWLTFHTHAHTHTQALLNFVSDYPGEPAPESKNQECGDDRSDVCFPITQRTLLW